MMLRRVLALIIAVLLCCAAAAQDMLPVPPLAGRVIDQTGTLSAAQAQALSAKALNRKYIEDGKAEADRLRVAATNEAAAIVAALTTASDGLGRSAHEVALAWVRDAPGVASAIVGARTAEQLAPSLAAEDLVLPDQIRTALDDVTQPPMGYPEQR